MSIPIIGELHNLVDASVLLAIFGAVARFTKVETKLHHVHDCVHELKEEFKEVKDDFSVFKGWVKGNLERRVVERIVSE